MVGPNDKLSCWYRDNARCRPFLTYVQSIIGDAHVTRVETHKLTRQDRHLHSALGATTPPPHPQYLLRALDLRIP
jgi:hypothetical protein